MVFHIVTIFPNVFRSYFNEGILRRAEKKKITEIKTYNLRDFTRDKRKTVDDRPFSGGPGMVLKVEPIYKTINLIKANIKKQKSKIILLSAKGKIFNQHLAYKFSKLDNLIFICGRYEGIDERVAKYIADEEISIGNYILSGGELAAMVIIETVTRLIPGALGNIESIEGRRLTIDKPQTIENKKAYSYPVYTRPEIFEPEPGIKWKVPKILLSGNHKKITDWREHHAGTK